MTDSELMGGPVTSIVDNCLLIRHLWCKSFDLVSQKVTKACLNELGEVT